MTILYILKHNPEGIGGGCMATHSFLKAFIEVFKDSNFDILVCKEYLQDLIYSYPANVTFHVSPKLSKTGMLYNYWKGCNHRHYATAINLLKKNKYDYCIFDHSSIAGSLMKYIPSYTKTIVVHHNYEVDYYRDNHGFINNLLMLPLVKQNEKNAFLKCSYNIFLTNEDLQQFKKAYGHNQRKNSVITVFETDEIKRPKSFEYIENKIVITGNLSNVQNVDGIIYYLKELHPLLPKHYTVVIAGKRPHAEIIKLAQLYENVSIIPSPPRMDDILEGSCMYICPTRLGSGVKIRIKDALRKGIPAIVHKVSARGYLPFIERGFIKEFDSAESFINAIRMFHGHSSKLRNELFDFFLEKYAFKEGVDRIKKML